MKLPLSWLREFIQLDAGVDEICRRLTLAGLEVENVEHLTPTFSDVFVAKVVAVEPHPNADRLRLCDVDAGAAGRMRVVCGAPNARAGMTAALAKVGARLAGGVHEGGGAHEGGRSLDQVEPLKAAVIRGVPSEGMLCSELELGMSADHEGILELSTDAALGLPLESYLQLPDIVLDIAITPNRGDCLSILGLARELAALFEVKLTLPPISAPKLRDNAEDWKPITVKLEAPELCPHYAALALADIKLGPSPFWIRRRLELCGMRSINNVVDVTNYVMLERGQPLHAFDASRIADHKLIVRRAGHDRVFETLDGVSRTLDADDLLIADPEKPLALAGVMGGRNSEVDPATRTIMLESAWFSSGAIARTARRLTLRSEASYRFERGIDRAGQVTALWRTAELLAQVADATPFKPLVDVEPHPAVPTVITLDLAAMNALLGTALPDTEVERRLVSLGCEVSNENRGVLSVTAPAHRPDLRELADLAEEVARLKGLAEVPATTPARTAVLPPANPRRALVRRIYEILLGCGFVETKSLAFIAPADNSRYANLGGLESAAVVNPLSAELSELRRSLLPGLLTALRFNLNREARAFHAFELGKVFGLTDGRPGEAERIAAVSYGDYAMGAIDQTSISAGFFSLKGVLETLLRALGDAAEFAFTVADPTRAPYLHPGRSAAIWRDGTLLGVLGELHPVEAARLELTRPCALFEIDLAVLLDYASQPRPAVMPPPRFPAIRRDVALLVDRTLPIGKVTATFSGQNSSLLERIELFDVYQGDELPPGKKSVAIACHYRRKDRTLTDDEVNRAHAALVAQAIAQLGAKVR